MQKSHKEAQAARAPATQLIKTHIHIDTHTYIIITYIRIYLQVIAGEDLPKQRVLGRTRTNSSSGSFPEGAFPWAEA